MKINYPDNEEFYSLSFYVDKRVLIPRNDTEVLVDQVIKTLKSAHNQDIWFIDIGTGSSAIVTAVTKNTPVSLKQIFAVDISLDALEVAKINIEKNNIQDKVSLYNSDLLQIFLSWNKKIEAKNLIITANLPYIKNGDIENMDQEVLDNEPHIALFWWEKTGFEMYERLIWQVFELKKNNRFQEIILFIEIWFDQYEYSQEYLKSLWLKYQYFKDLNNIFRCIKIKF